MADAAVNHEAQTVTRNLFGEHLTAVDYSAMPWTVFASPEKAGVGATGAELREHGQEYDTRTYEFDQTAR